MTKHSDLIARIEAAEGQSRELIVAAYEAVNGTTQIDYAKWNRFATLVGHNAWLDAAMTLVPEGWSFVLAEKVGLPPGKRFECWLHDHNTESGIAERHIEANASTPALALCAAALRAQETSNGE